MSASDFLPAIRYDGDAYDVGGARLMGRQAASFGLLRAAVQAAGGATLVGYGAQDGSAAGFVETVRSLAPDARTEWIPLQAPQRLARARVCFRPDALLSAEARMRLRAGPAAYSLCGVSHTTASAGMMEEFTRHLTEPLLPWDAVICPAACVAETVRERRAAQAEFLSWRLGTRISPEDGPQLPVIPLGVHTADFAAPEGRREAARRGMGIAPEEIAALYVGRIMPWGKASPLPMFQALQAAAQRAGRRVTLILCGWSPNEAAQKAVEAGAAAYAPDVRLAILDGRGPVNRQMAWAAGDIFISLVDGVQETFGLTPVEAMAAGLPVVVSDWNGYRETVRDGVDGFRIRTFAPAEGGEDLASAYEATTLSYDRYVWGAAAATALDLDQAAARLSALMADPELRRRMGAAGQARARAAFDWAVVFRQYQELWTELDARRLAEAARADGAPPCSPAAPDIFKAFAHYPTQLIGPETLVRLRPQATAERLAALAAEPLLPASLGVVHPSEAAWRRLADGAASVRELSAQTGGDLAAAARLAGLLAKAGLADLDAP